MKQIVKRDTENSLWHLSYEKICSTNDPKLVESTLRGFRREDLTTAVQLAEEVSVLLGPSRRINPKRLRDVVGKLVDVAREGEGVLLCDEKGLVDILPKTELKAGRTFEGFQSGVEVHGLRVGRKYSQGRAGLSLVFSPSGERYEVDREAALLVFRGLLEKRGFSLAFEWDYKSPTIRKKTRDAMAAYLENGDDMLLGLPTIPIDRKILLEVVKNLESWPELRRRYALRGDPLISSRKYDSLYLRDWTRLHSGAFKDRAAVVEVGLCLMTHKMMGGRVVGLMSTTGNMGASFSKTLYHATHTPDGELIYNVRREPALLSMLYGTNFNSLKRDVMRRYGAITQEGYESFNQAFNEMVKAMWGKPLNALPVWCGDTSIRIEASKLFAYELALDIVKKQGNGSVVADYLKSGRTDPPGRQILDDVVGKLTAVIQVGNGVNYAGIAKGFYEMKELGIIRAEPTLIPVQPENALDIQVAYDLSLSGSDEGLFEWEPFRPHVSSVTKADGIDCLLPVVGHEVYHRFKKSSLKVSDNEMLAAQKKLERREKINCELAAAAGYAALIKDEELKRLLSSDDKTVVVFITGSKKS